MIQPFIDITFLIHVIGMHYNMSFEVYTISENNNEIVGRDLIQKSNYSVSTD